MLVCHKNICLKKQKTLLNIIFYFQYIMYLWENKNTFFIIDSFWGVPHFHKDIKLIKIIYLSIREPLKI